MLSFRAFQALNNKPSMPAGGPMGSSWRDMRVSLKKTGVRRSYLLGRNHRRGVPLSFSFMSSTISLSSSEPKPSVGPPLALSCRFAALEQKKFLQILLLPALAPSSPVFSIF